MDSTRISIVAVFAIAAWCSQQDSASAARLLHAEIEHDGQVVLRSAYQDQGTADAGAVWRYLGKEPLWVEKGAAIKPAADSDRKSRLKGTIRIRVMHADRAIVEAKAAELLLVRDSAADEKWRFPPEEVERLAKANSIPNPPALAILERDEVRIGLAVAGAGVVAVLVWLVLRRRG